MKLKRIKGKKKGFSLVEIVVAASIFVILSGIMLTFFIQGLNLWQLITSQSNLRSIAANAMNYIKQELQKTTHTSSEIPSPNLFIPSEPNNNSVDFYLPADSEEDNNDIIIDDIGNTEWDMDNKIQYQYVPGEKQLRRLEKGEQYIIANNVSSIKFEDNSINPALYNNELKIVLTLESATPQNRVVSVTLTSILKLRN